MDVIGRITVGDDVGDDIWVRLGVSIRFAVKQLKTRSRLSLSLSGWRERLDRHLVKTGGSELIEDSTSYYALDRLAALNSMRIFSSY